MVPAKNPATSRIVYLIIGVLILEHLALGVGIYRYSTGRWPIHFDSAITGRVIKESHSETLEEGYSRILASIQQSKVRLGVKTPSDQSVWRFHLPAGAKVVNYSRCEYSSDGKTCNCYDETSLLIPDSDMCFQFMSGHSIWRKGDPLPTRNDSIVRDSTIIEFKPGTMLIHPHFTLSPDYFEPFSTNKFGAQQ